MFSHQQWRRYSVVLVAIASLFLVIGLALVRTSRIATVSVPFFTLEFIALSMIALGLVAGAFWLAVSGRVVSWLGRMPLQRRVSYAAVWVLLSYAGAILLFNAIAVLQPYFAPFIPWLTLINLGIVLLALGGVAEVTPTHYPQWLRPMLFVVLGLLLPLLIVEVGLRVWFTYFGTEADRISYLYTDAEIEARGRLIGLPYVNFGLSPAYPEHNSLGYRGAEIENPKPEDLFRIVALGGSTTYGVSLNPWETYPAQLQQILRDDYGYTNVEVVNGGVVSYASWDTLVNFEFRVLDIQPDMVIVYHAINDVMARLVDPADYNGLNPARGIWQRGRFSFSPSVLYRLLAVNVGWMGNPSLLENYLLTNAPVLRCPERDYCAALQMTPVEVLAANPPIYFERNIRNLITIARENDVQVFISSWAYYQGERVQGIDPVMTFPHIQQAVAEHNAITQRLAEAYELPYYDLMANLPENIDYWLDGLHQSTQGAHEQAVRYAQFLVENHLLPEPN